MDSLEILARVIGGFYALGGVFVVRAMIMDAFLDRALAGITLKPVPAKDRLRNRLLMTGGVLTCLSGLALLMLSLWATALFAANVALQVAWLLIARVHFKPEDETEAKGRRRSINALVGYAVVGALVGALAWQGRLHPWDEAAALAVLAVSALGLVAWIVRGLSLPHRRQTAHDDAGEDQDDDAPAWVAAKPNPTHLRIAPEHHCWPLWDDETGDNVDHFEIDLPFALKDSIEAWDLAFQADPAMPAAMPQDLVDAITRAWSLGRVVLGDVQRAATV